MIEHLLTYPKFPYCYPRNRPTRRQQVRSSVDESSPY